MLWFLGRRTLGSIYAAEMFYNHLEARLLDGSFQSCVPASEGGLLLLQGHLICACADWSHWSHLAIFLSPLVGLKSHLRCC